MDAFEAEYNGEFGAKAVHPRIIVAVQKSKAWFKVRLQSRARQEAESVNSPPVTGERGAAPGGQGGTLANPQISREIQQPGQSSVSGSISEVLRLRLRQIFTASQSQFNSS